jgi:hypothetical protein
VVTIVTRETIDDRWLTLITGPDGHGREGTSELYERLTGAVGELAVRMVHGLRDSGSEADRLIALIYRVEQLVEQEVKDFATKVETERPANIDASIVPDAAHSRSAANRAATRRSMSRATAAPRRAVP